MGFRFRKRIKIAPGININLSKSGISTSLGMPGATVNVGKRGVRVTAGIPGTGLSYQTNLSGRSVPDVRRELAAEGKRMGDGAGCLLHGTLGLLGFALFSAMPEGAGFGFVLIYSVIWAVLAGWVGSVRKKKLAEMERQRLAAMWDELAARFDGPTATRIMKGEIMQGDSREIVELALGEPEDVSERVMKSKTRHVLKYGRINARSFALKITLEDDHVVGWDS